MPSPDTTLRDAVDASPRGAARSDVASGDNASNEVRAGRLRLLTGTLLTVLWAGSIWWLSRSGLYTPGSDTGYYLGLAGALMMLALLGYPLRKRVRLLSSAGRVSRWFSAHMVLGVAGPTLILLHCTLHWRSLNAAIAFWCMVIVAGSGLLGRYLYRHLHVGLYGRQLSLGEVRTDAATTLGKLRDRLRADEADDVRAIVDGFLRDAAVVETRGWKRPDAMLLLAPRAWLARARALSAARDRRAARGPLRPDAQALVAESIAAVQRSAQFLPFERLFALWHVLHVPLVVLLVFSVIAHIVAVHMY